MSSNDLIIKEMTSERGLKEFINFPSVLYSGVDNYVPSLYLDELDTLSRKNPAYEYCETKFFMAYKGNKPVGRICGLLNKEYNKCWSRNCVRFTRFDFIDDISVSSALLARVEQWAKEIGMDEVQGPMGFCDLDKQGMLIEGFDEPGMFITIYNFPYYVKHMEALGYSKAVDWVEFLIEIPEELPEKITRIADISLRRNHLKLLEIKKTKELLPYAKGIFQLVYEAYKDLYGVIPLTNRQIDMYVKQFITLIKPDFITVILDQNDKPVSFGVVIPSLSKAMKKNNGHLFPFGFIPIFREINAKKHDRLEFLLIATKPELQGKGINANIMVDIFNSAKKSNIKFAETGPMLETNNKIQSMWKHFTNHQHKRRRCYIKKL